MATLQAPYLRAIQCVPGDTPAEKFQWISGLISDRCRARGESGEALEPVEFVESPELPRALIPLVKVEAAKCLKQCDGIVEALKSDDSVVVNKALQASWFFDGTNRDVLNVDYFSKNLFPFVSLKTRGKILKSMSAHLRGQRADVAEEFFRAVVEMYGIEQAFPLLTKCSDKFVYDTVVERDLILPRKILKRLFRKNPDLVVRYLRLSNPEKGKKNVHSNVIQTNCDFLAKLVQRRLQAFLELYEMHEKNPPTCKLSNKCAYYFLKNAKERLMSKPQLYMRLVPLKLINAKRMEIILPKLFPQKKRDFDVNGMIAYLKYYPEDKKANLLTNSYKQVYGESLLEQTKFITRDLMNILPADERVKLAKIMLEKEGRYKKVPYVHVDIPWECYLSAETSIPLIKQEIARTSSTEDRYDLLRHLFFACKVNKDDNALLSVLDYYRSRHRNEQAWVLQRIMELLVDHFELYKLSKLHWVILYDIIRRGFVKNELTPGCSTARILEPAIHFTLIQNMPIDQLIDMLVECKALGWDPNWQILSNYPEYARVCLEACLGVVEKKIDCTDSWKNNRTEIPVDLFGSFCQFNKAYVKPNNKIERLSLKNYPWLMKRLETIAKSCRPEDHYPRQRLKESLKTCEKEIFLSWYPEENVIADVTTGDALARLKKDPQHILDNYKAYVEKCRDSHYRKSVWNFLRATRWYKDVGIKFAEECLKDFRHGEKAVSIFLLAILLHGNTYTDLIEPLIPDAKTIEVQSDAAKANYDSVVYISYGIKVANPPVPLHLVGKLCGGDYMSRALVALTSVSRRISLTKVIPFASTLVSNRVSVKKHGIRLICMVASLQETVALLSSMWDKETHPSIREVLYQRADSLFLSDPKPITWNLIKHFISSLTSRDKAILLYLNKIERVPRAYVVDYVKLLLDLIDGLPAKGFDESQYQHVRTQMLLTLDGVICNLLPDDLCRRILELCFNSDPNSTATFSFANAFLLSSESDEILRGRLASFSEVFTEAIRTKWNIRHPKIPNYYPMNCGVSQFTSNLISAFAFKNKKDKEQLIVDELMKMFLGELSPVADPSSYLTLLFAQHRFASKNPRELGLKIGGDFSRLANVFSAAFAVVVYDVIRSFLRRKIFDDFEVDEINMGFREGLADVGNVEALVFVVAEPPIVLKSEDLTDRYETFLKRIRNTSDPAVRSALSYRVNSYKYSLD